MSVPVLWKDRISGGRILFSMRALGRRDVPPRLALCGRIYELETVLKHDFYACTAFYRDASGQRVVAKFGRTADCLGLPLRWIGRMLVRREVRFYRALADLPAVPRLLGTIGDVALIHEYVPGTPLSKHRRVPGEFFDELTALLKELHRRGIAYVDTNKPQNILHGDDNRPHLIDFQISWDLVGLGNTWLNRRLLRYLQRMDLYHATKQKMRFRKDLLTREEADSLERRGLLLSIHRAILAPYKKFRRGTISRLRRSGTILPEGSK